MNDQRTFDATDRRRVAVIADGTTSTRGGIATTLRQLRERDVPGYQIDVIGTEALTDRRYDLVHICTPGPAGVPSPVAHDLGVPMIASHHADLEAQARIDARSTVALAALYTSARAVLSPSASADRSLDALGVPRHRILRWGRGVELDRFHPARYAPDALPDGFNILYAGRLAQEKGVELLAESFLIARDRDPRLRLVLAGGGPEEHRLRARLRNTASFLGWLDPDRLASVYASAELLVCPSATEAFGQVILEAQASGLPVLAIDDGACAELIDSGRSGCLAPPEPEALASAIRGLARREALRDRLATGGLMAVQQRSAERSLAQLADAYDAALAPAVPHAGAEVARAA